MDANEATGPHLSLTNSIVDDNELKSKLEDIKKGFNRAVDLTNKRQAELASFYESGNSYKAGTAVWFDSSRKLLTDPETPGSILLLAAKNLLGPAMLTWDPDTIWVELEDHRSLKIPLENRNKLLAAIVLVDMPMFLWDVDAFSTTVLAFNDVIPDPMITQDTSTPFLAWGVAESTLLLERFSTWGTSLDREPVVYTAACLHTNGLSLAPDVLSFSQDSLDTLNRNSAAPVAEEVRAAWEEIPKTELTTRTFSDAPLDTQLRKLTVTRTYLLERSEKYLAKIHQLLITPQAS